GNELLPGLGVCGNLQEIPLPTGQVACTHGPDPAPDGVDIRVPFEPGKARTGLLFPDPPTGRTTAEAAGPGGIRCYTDGTGGRRVHAIYARPSDRPDRYAQVVGSIRTFAAETDEVFRATAARYGAVRHIRFVTDSQCQLVVDNVVLSPAGDDNIDTTMAELSARGYNNPNRKYVVWMDSTVLCGIAAYYPNDRPDALNPNNGPAGVPGLVARIDSGCWGLSKRGGSVEAHELMHSLGSVLPSAPHSTAAGHCDDESDRMCYPDGSVLVVRDVCSEAQETQFDCGGDDYFHPSPPNGSYLATRWNTARSAFLATSAGDPTISVGDTQVVEGDAGTSSAVFTVALAAPSGSGVSVRFRTSAGSAALGGDFSGVNGIVSFSPGETAKTVAVPVVGDTAEEPDETFSLTLSEPVGGPMSDAEAVGRILDDDPKRFGYRLVASDGGIFAFGDAPFYGSTGNVKLNKPINGMAPTPSGAGYWMVASDGGIFSFGDAGFFGSTGAMNLRDPIVGLTPTPSGQGYRMVTGGGEVFSFGDAPRLPVESLAARPAEPIMGISSTPSGAGYWLVGRDGNVTNFGDAPALGSTGPLSEPIANIAATPSGGGFWVVTSGGGIFSFGDARFLGSLSGTPLNRPVVGLAPTATGNGYWMVASDGGIFAFGDAFFLGSTGGINLNQPVVGMTSVR
ncbi:MAG: Calx-beta domain-containing protein, partial [Acidimicrobiia bacterium]